MEKKVAVAYLVWVPFGIELYKQFLHSYLTKKAGADHTLLLLFNGVKNNNEVDEFIALTKNNNLEFDYLIRESGQDMEVYYWACGKVEYDIILFLNSYSTFNADNWLKIYLDNFTDDVGMIGASASKQSIYSSVFHQNKLSWNFDKTFKQNFDKYKLLIKTFLVWRWWFKAFPCAHLRATAYMLRRKDYLEIKSKFPLRKKLDAYKIECGFDSMTNQILRKGLKVGVVNTDGNYFDLNDAYQSNTFRVNNQEKLLINDKQTDWYKSASEAEKKEFTFLAWGK